MSLLNRFPLGFFMSVPFKLRGPSGVIPSSSKNARRAVVPHVDQPSRAVGSFRCSLSIPAVCSVGPDPFFTLLVKRKICQGRSLCLIEN